jgi:hypothetical protein
MWTLGLLSLGGVLLAATNLVTGGSTPGSLDVSSLTQYGFGGVSLTALVIAIIDNLRKSNASYVKKLEERFQIELNDHKSRIVELEKDLKEERSARLELLEELRQHKEGPSSSSSQTR